MCASRRGVGDGEGWMSVCVCGGFWVGGWMQEEGWFGEGLRRCRDVGGTEGGRQRERESESERERDDGETGGWTDNQIFLEIRPYNPLSYASRQETGSSPGPAA
jgi:hypothetical protein